MVRCKQKQRGLRGLLCRWPSITEWEMYITAQGPRLRNDLYCVEWDVELYYTIPYHIIPYHTIPTSVFGHHNHTRLHVISRTSLLALYNRTFLSVESRLATFLILSFNDNYVVNVYVSYCELTYVRQCDGWHTDPR